MLIPELLPAPTRAEAGPASGRLAGRYGEPHVSWVGLLVDVYG